MIGGVTPACVEVAARLYQCVVDRVVPVDSPKVAEMVKLLENTFRATNIALVNEFAIMCGRLGIDIWHVIEAAKTKPFGFMPFYPGPGLGGHCIPIDPQYLAWKLKTVNYNARFIQLAAEINFGMPSYVAGKIAHALNEESKPMRGSRVLVLGVAYKEGVADLRESPALDLVRLAPGAGSRRGLQRPVHTRPSPRRHRHGRRSPDGGGAAAFRLRGHRYPAPRLRLAVGRGQQLPGGRHSQRHGRTCRARGEGRQAVVAGRPPPCVIGRGVRPPRPPAGLVWES